MNATFLLVLTFISQKSCAKYKITYFLCYIELGFFSLLVIRNWCYYFVYIHQCNIMRIILCAFHVRALRQKHWFVMAQQLNGN